MANRCNAMVYLLHFDPPYRHAKHYIGFVIGGNDALANRVDLHRTGGGARLCEVAVTAGVKLKLARTWPDGDRALERKLKRRKCSSRICPVCKGQSQ